MSDEQIKIAIAEPSMIIRSGLSAALKRMTGIRVQIFEIANIDLLPNYLRMQKPDILIINPSFWGMISLVKLKQESEHPTLKCIALLAAPVDEMFLKEFEARIGLYDSLDVLKQKIELLTSSEMDNDGNDDEENDKTDSLSVREREVLTCVVKGQTNKEIAQTLFLSTHTVITHRRNIARKLGIHSTAGLTIYAIVNKLVELDDIKNML
jgi:DNA-binding NarL/FixJ family response regulator